jgi:UDP-N-acetylmuramate dehydrogenase
MPDYPGVKKYFDSNGIIAPTLQEIRDAIIQIRASKLPDPKHIKNAGSFFKNPIVATAVADELKAAHPDLVMFSGGEGKTKLSAGWLIEHGGLKGQSIGPIKVYEHNALVLTNTGDATCDELQYAAAQIIKKVEEKFGVKLEQEPVFIG